MRSRFREIGWTFVSGLTATLLTFMLFLLIQAASFWTPKERIEEHLRDAFETGALDLYDSRPFDSDLGYHQGRDCLIYGMTILRPDEAAAYVTAPRYVFDPAGRATLCETLRDRLYGEVSTKNGEHPHLHFLHGYRAVVAATLSVIDVPQMRALFKALTYLLLLGTVLLAAWQLVLSLAGHNTVSPIRPLGSIAVAAAFALYYGLAYFGQSPAHAPAAWVLFGFLLFATHSNLYRLPAARFYAAIAVFGAWVAFFEFFTGSLLIGLCLLIGLLAIHAHKKILVADMLWRSLLAPLVYLGAIALCVTLTLLLQTWQIGAEVLPSFSEALRVHASGMLESRPDAPIILETGPLTLSGLIDALIRKVGVLSAGNLQIGVFVLVMSVHVLIGALLLVTINGKKRRDLLRLGLCLASVLPIIAWLLLLPNHTLTQSAYMVRILVWLPAAAGIALTIAVEVCLARYQVGDHLGLREANFRGGG
jgi:hypothetical protein